MFALTRDQARETAVKAIAVISRKGGAGKTTVAVNLALMAHARGLRVLVVDSDPQRSASHCLKARATSGPAVREAQAGKLYQLGLSARREGFDLMIIDTAAHPDADVAQAANTADLCLIACRPTFLDIAAVLQSAEMMRRLNRRGAVVLTQAPPPRGSSVSPAVRRAGEALALTGLPLVGIVSTRVVCQQSLAAGLSALEAGSVAAGGEFQQLWRAIERELTNSGGTAFVYGPGLATDAAARQPSWSGAGFKVNSALATV